MVVVVGGVPLPLTPPLGVVGEGELGVVVVGVVSIGLRCNMTPENSRFPDWFASFIRTAVLTVFEICPSRADVAEASTVTIDRSRLVATASVASLGNRSPVFA